MSFVCSQLTCTFLRISQPDEIIWFQQKHVVTLSWSVGAAYDLIYHSIPVCSAPRNLPSKAPKITHKAIGMASLALSWEVHKHTRVLLLKSVYTFWLCVSLFGVCEFRFVHARTSMQQQEDKRSQCSPSAMWVLKLNPCVHLSWHQVPFLARSSCWLFFFFSFLLPLPLSLFLSSRETWSHVA